MSLNKGFPIFFGCFTSQTEVRAWELAAAKKNFLSQEAQKENPEIYVNTKTVGAICGSGRAFVGQTEKRVDV